MKYLGLVLGIILVGAMAIAAEPNTKAERYLEALRKRPDSQTLFDRFFDTWLDSGTINDLETFLKKGAGDGNAANELIAATFYLRQGNDQAAAEWLEKVVTADSSSAEIRAIALTELGQISGRALEFETAMKYLNGAAKALGELDDPDEEKEDELAKLRGRILVRSGQAEAGLEAWKAILKKRPEDEILQENVIELLADEGLYDEAIELQVELIENSKDAYQTVLRRIQLGRLFRRADQKEKSVAAWRDALPATGHGTWIEREVIALIDSAFRRKDDLKGLRGEVEKMIEDEPKRLSLKVAYAELLSQLREDKKALEVWEEILKLTPGDRDLQLQFVRTLASLERPREGAERMRSLIKLNPEDAELVFELAQLQKLSGDVAGAGESLETFLEKSDGSEYSYLRVARQLQRYLLVERAEAVFEKLNAEFPESAGAKESYATFLYETERKGRAIEIWESLGKAGDRGQLLRSTRQLAQRFESEAAFNLLKSRFTEFENDLGFLAELCQLSLPLEKAAEAFPWAQKRVDLATSSDELIPAIELASTVATRTGDVAGLIETLADVENKTIASVCLLAELRSRNGEVDQAISDLEKAVSVAEGKEILFPLVTLSRLQRREEQWADSAKTMERVVASPGGRRSSHIQELVELFEKASDSTASLKWAREWKKIAPGSSLPWTKEAAMLDRQGLISESLAVLQDAARRFEKSPDVQIQLSAAYASAGFPLEAERVLWRLYDDAADDWARRGWIDELVRTAQANGRVDEVLAKFQERQKNNSQAMGPLLALAEFYQLINKPDEYRETLLAAGRIDPRNVDLVLKIVSLDEQAGRYDAAIQGLEKIRAKDTSSRTVERLAKIHLNLGNISQALQLMEEMPSGKKASVAQLVSMGQVIATIGEWETLANFLTPKLADHPDDHSIRYLRAIALVEGGNKAAAKEAFLELLNFEVPAVVSSNPVVHPYAINFGGGLTTPTPPSVTELTTWVNSSIRARSYRVNAGEGGTIYSLIGNTNQGSNPAPIPVPTTQVMLQSYAVGQLAFLSEGDEELEASLVAAGVSRMRLELVQLNEKLANLSKSGINVWQLTADDERLLPIRKAIRELMDRYPDNAELHSYWATVLMIHYPDEALANRTLDLVREKFGMDLAVTFAFQAAQGKSANYYWSMPNMPATPAPSVPILARALEMTKELESVSDALAIQLSNYMAREISLRESAEDPRVSGEAWAAMHEVLGRWQMEAADKKMPWGNVTAFQSVMRVLASDGKNEAWMERLESEIARFEKVEMKDPAVVPPAANSNALGNGGIIFSGSHFGNYYGNQAIPEPVQIPERMPNFSPAVLGLLRKEADQNQNYYRRSWIQPQSQLANLDNLPSDLPERLPEFSDRPLLYSLFAHALDDKESLEAGAEMLRDTEEKNLTPAEALFLAHQETKAKNVEEAIAQFERVRYESIDFQTAKSIDLAIVSLVQKQPEEAGFRPVGLKAALRLRASKAVDPLQDWPAVAKVLKAWGHENKAKISGRNKVAAASNPYQIQRSHFRAPMLRLANLQSTQSKLQRLLDDQQEEAAIRVAAKLLPLASGNVLNFQGENHKQSFQQLVAILKNREGLIDSILKEATPTENSRRLDQVRFATLCDVLQKNDEAISRYEALLKSRPEDSILQLRMLHLLAQSDPAKAVAQLKRLRKKEPSEGFVSMALNAISQANMPLSQRLDTTETLMELIEIPEGKPVLLQRWTWLTQLVSRLEQNFNNDGRRIPSLHDPDFENDSYRPKDTEKRKEYDALIRRRLAVYIELSKRAMIIPENAPRIFSQLVRLKQLEGSFENELVISDTDLLELCKETLLVMPPRADYFWGTLQAPPRKFSNGKMAWQDPENPAPQWTATGPIPWLVEYAVRTNQQGLIDEQTLLLREKRNDGDLIIDAFESLQQLYFCEPTEFAKTINQIDDESLKTQNQYRMKWDFVQRVIALRPAVNEDFDSDALIFAEFKKGPNDQLARFAGYRFQEIAAEKGIKGASEFLEEVANNLLGTGEIRANLIQKYLPIRYNGHQQNTNHHRLVNMLTFLNQVGEQPSGAFAVARFARNAKLSQSQNYGVSWNAFNQNLDVTTSGPFEVFLKNSTLLNDLSDYETFPAEEFAGFSRSGYDSMVSSLLSRLRDRFKGLKENQKAEFKESVNHDSFGAKILTAVMAEQPDAELLSVFDSHVVEIQKLPKRKREELAQLGASLIRMRSLPTPVTEDQRGTLRWMAQESGDGVASKMDRLIAAKSIGELDQEPDQFYNFVESEISDALFYDWEKAFRAFENVAMLGDAAVKNGSIHWSQQYPFSVYLLRSLVGKTRPVEGFALLNEAFHSEKLPELFIDLPQIHSPVETSLRNAGSDENKIKVLAGFAKQVNAELPADGDSALALPVFYQLIRSQPSSFIEKAIEWADGPDGIGLMPKLARDIGVVLRIKKSGSSKFPEDEAILQRLEDALKNPKIPAGLRFSISEFVCEVSSGTPVNLIQQAGRNLASAWTEGETIAHYPTYDILRAVDRQFKKQGLAEWEKGEWPSIDDAIGEAMHEAMVVKDPKINNDNILVFGIQIQLRRGKPILANEFFAKYESEIDYPGGVFVEMVRYGQHEVAARVLRTHLEKVVSGSVGSQYFDPVLAKQVEPFITSLGDEQPWIQWIGKYVLTSLGDPYNGQPVATDWPNRTSRVKEAAEKLATLEVPRDSLKELLVSRFLGSEDLENTIREKIADVTDGQTVLEIGRLKNSTETYLKTKLLAAQLLQEIAKGEDERAIQAIRDYDKLSDTAKNRIDSYLFVIADSASKRFKTDKEISKIVVRLWQEVAQRNSYSATSSSTEYAVGRIIAAHFRSGEEARLDQFFDGLPDETRKVFTSVIKRGSTRMTETFVNSFSDLSAADKRAVERKFNKLELPTLGIKNIGKTRTEQFLAAKTFAESKFQHYNFEVKVNELLNGAESLSERRKIYQHAIKLVQLQMDSDKGWGSTEYTNGWSYASEQLQEYCAVATAEPWAGISIVADVLWHETPDDIEFTWENIYKFGAAFRPRWRKLVAQKTADEALPVVLDELRNSLRTPDQSKWGSSAVFFPYFFDCCEAIQNPTEVRWMIGAADKLLLENENDVLARELAMAGRLWMSMKKSAETVAKKIPQLDDWIHHVTELMNSEETSAQLKMSTIRCVLHQGEGFCPESLRRNFCEVGADLILAETPLNGWVFSLILEDFVELPRNAEWDRVAEKFAKGWAHKNRNNGISKNKGIGFHPVDEPILGMLNLLLKRGDKDSTKKHLDEFGALIKEDPRGPAIMILNGEYDKAQEWIMENFISYNPNNFWATKSKIDIRYDEKLHAAREKFLATMEPGEAQFFCAYYMAFPSDPIGEKKPDPAVIPSRVKRMVTLAKQFKDVEFSNDKNRHHAEYLMTRLWQSAAFITNHLKPRFETFDAERLSSNRNSIEGGRVLYPAMGYTFGKLNQGDAKPFAELVTRVGNGPAAKADYYRQHYLKQFNYVLLKFIDAKFPNANHEQITMMREASAAFLETIDCSSSGSEFGDQMRCQIVLAAMQNDQAGLAKWRTALPMQEQKDLQTILRKQRSLSPNYLSKLLNVATPNPVSDEIRWTAVSALLSDPWFQSAWDDAPNGFVLKPLLQRKLLTDEQIKEKGEALIELWPRKGKMASELAEWYMSNQDPETAIQFANAGAKSAAGSVFSKRLILHKVNCLVDLEKYETASDLLASVKVENLPADLKNMRSKAASKLKRKLELEVK